MASIILILLFIAGIGAFEHTANNSQKPTQSLQLLDYAYIGSNFVLPVVQKAARSDSWDIDFPNTFLDIRCIERLNVSQNQLVFTISIAPRGTVTNHDLEIHLRNELVSVFARYLQVDYKLIRQNLHVRIVDVPRMLQKNVWLEFSDEMRLAIINAQYVSYL